MKCVLQRVREASVQVEETCTGKIGKGYLLLIGICEEDTEEDAEWLVRKIINMRLFPDSDGKMNLSLQETGGAVLCVSQFTLFADYRKGNRPSFIKAARPETAIPLFEKVKEKFSAEGIQTESGIFGADMKVSLLNDGPVTICIDTKTKC